MIRKSAPTLANNFVRKSRDHSHLAPAKRDDVAIHPLLWLVMVPLGAYIFAAMTCWKLVGGLKAMGKSRRF